MALALSRSGDHTWPKQDSEPGILLRSYGLGPRGGCQSGRGNGLVVSLSMSPVSFVLTMICLCLRSWLPK
jgi:hypothetical protein